MNEILQRSKKKSAFKHIHVILTIPDPSERLFSYDKTEKLASNIVF